MQVSFVHTEGSAAWAVALIIPSILNLEVSLDGTLSSQPCVEKLNTGPNHPTTPQFGDLNLHLIHLDSKG